MLDPRDVLRRSRLGPGNRFSSDQVCQSSRITTKLLGNNNESPTVAESRKGLSKRHVKAESALTQCDFDSLLVIKLVSRQFQVVP